MGGRVTYSAQHLETGQFAVIKQFQFALAQSNWGDYESLEGEIEILRHLKHPGIPRYLDSFPTENDFCLVQEYLDAKSLATLRSWTPQQVKDIALSILEILVYLQSQNPPRHSSRYQTGKYSHRKRVIESCRAQGSALSEAGREHSGQLSLIPRFN